MIEIPAEEISAWVGRFLWPLFRVTAFLMAMPVIGTQLVPMRIRLGLAVAISLVVAPLLPEMPRLDGLSLATYLLDWTANIDRRVDGVRVTDACSRFLYWRGR